MTSSVKQPSDEYQVTDHEWLPVGSFKTHVCCDCGLAHKVRYRIYEGVMQEQWSRDDRETKRQRKSSGRKSN
jgi:hypothetical protein